MAGQDVLDAALVLFDEIPVALSVIAPHRGVEIDHAADQPVFHGLDAELHSRVVAVHVTDLDRQLRRLRLIQQLLELRQRLAARLIQMNVLARADAVQRDRHIQPLFGLDRHSLETGNRQQFLLAHPVQPLVTLVSRHFARLARMVTRQADHLEQLRQFAQRAHFVGMLITGADLADLDGGAPGGRRILPEGRPRRSETGSREKSAPRKRCLVLHVLLLSVVSFPAQLPRGNPVPFQFP